MATEERRETVRTRRRPFGHLLGYGILGGILAGIVFAIGEMIINVAVLNQPFLGPVRLISSILLGPEVLQNVYSTITWMVVGVAVHLVMSALYGVIFMYLLGAFGQLEGSSTALLWLYGAIFGLVLWVVNFLIIAPFVFPQFTQVNQFWSGFVAHTFLFGLPLGIYATSAQRRPAIAERYR